MDLNQKVDVQIEALPVVSAVLDNTKKSHVEVVGIIEHDGKQAVNARELHAEINVDAFDKEFMTSLEIAELTGKQHSNVMRDIRGLLDQGVNEFNFELVEYKDKKGETRPMFKLTKKGCLILASGYNAVLREKIINRWEELEKKERGQFTIPQTYSEALLLAANQAKKIEEQQLAIEQKQLALEQKDAENAKLKENEQANAPYVTYAKAVVGCTNSNIYVDHLAKIITQNGYKIGRDQLFEWLRNNGYLGKSKGYWNIPNQQYMNSGLFFIYHGMRSAGNGELVQTSTTKITPKGQIYFVNKFLFKTNEQADLFGFGESHK